MLFSLVPLGAFVAAVAAVADLLGAELVAAWPVEGG
jgi:hypothetical protein